MPHAFTGRRSGAYYQCAYWLVKFFLDISGGFLLFRSAYLSYKYNKICFRVVFEQAEDINEARAYNGVSADPYTCLLYTSPSPRDRG